MQEETSSQRGFSFASIASHSNQFLLPQEKQNQIVDANQVQLNTYYPVISQTPHPCNVYSVRINNESNMMIACSDQIYIFEILECEFKLLQKIRRKHIRILEMMKQQNGFIFDNLEGKIEIWIFDKDQNQYLQSNQLILSSKTSSRNSTFIVMNSCGNQILYHNNEYLKVYRYQHQWIVSQILKIYTQNLNSLDLNQEENLLVSCGDENIITIYQLSNEGKWKKKQRIQVEESGKSCFLTNTKIIFRPRGNKLFLFGLEESNEIFINHCVSDQKKEANKSFFFFGCLSKLGTIIFNKKKQMLICQNDRISIIEFLKSNKFVHRQEIDFKTVNCCCALSIDGEYLVVWNDDQKVFEMRKYYQPINVS